MDPQIATIASNLSDGQKFELAKSLLDGCDINQLNSIINKAKAIRRQLIIAATLTRPWWSVYADCDIVPIDCEYVSIKHLSGADRNKCASISIVNVNGDEIYS